ncbi:hypothetical protein [Pendulispora albinea]|uniref:Tetratricopeptide repeat protein n=1 Tax=Pendulispora albinea TaxID=2741071 RepID=A0ABZ2M3K8_9BACT
MNAKARKTNTRGVLGALCAMLLGATAIACGGGAEGKGPQTPQGGSKGGGPSQAVEVNKEAQSKFFAAIDVFHGHDKASNWNEAACQETAGLFKAAAAEQKGGKFPEATFNAGLAWQRCGNDKEAKALFEKTLSEDPKFHHARVQLALYQYKADGNEDAAISALQQSVLDSQFENIPALVNLAMFQMQRDSAAAGDGCKNDMDCAKMNIQRALAKDDAYMPAFNQLALYYFQQAKKRAGSVKVSSGKGRGRTIATNSALAKRADVQQLELAALVCSQAVRKNPSYAPIHNTAGLIQNELGQVNGAVAEFNTAAKLDPKFFEAQMNYAFVNLSFRGFEQAQAALRRALDMRPNDYDAHLGMALALRGLITDANYDAQVNAVQAELDAAKKLDPSRPDAYYNEGILTHEYKAKGGGGKDKTMAALNQAKSIYSEFVVKATGRTEYDGAVKRAKERMQDIDDTLAFLSTSPDASQPGAAPAGAPGAAEAPKK